MREGESSGKKFVGIHSIQYISSGLHHTCTSHPTFSILLHLSYYTTSAVFDCLIKIYSLWPMKQSGRGREGEGKMGRKKELL